MVCASLVSLLIGFTTPAQGLDIVLGDIEAEAAPANAVEGAALKTDSETDELLARADQFAKDGRYDLASTLWQTVIDSSNDLVFTRDEWIEKTLEHSYQRYLSVSGDIESTLAKLPEAGLEGYRIKGDGEAKLALAKTGADQREGALAEVVRRFFLSSLGDDAAFELACRKLDRYEFLPAIRLLDKIITDYPDPSVSKDEVLLRLAALNARVGEPKRALEIVADLKSRVTPAVPDAVLELVEKDILKSRDVTQQTDPGASVWPMAMGSPGRSGLMRGAGESPGPEAGEFWAQPYSLELPEGWPPLPKDSASSISLNVDDPFALGVARAQRSSSSNNKPSTPATMLKAWPKHGWRPAARALLHAGRIYFKNNNRLVCADAATGELRWLGFRTTYPVPPAINVRNPYGRQDKGKDVAGRAPKDANEVQNFSDSVNQSMCIVRDKILTIQGKPMDFTEEDAPAPPAPPAAGRFGRGGGTAGPARYRENRLVAFHARNGKLQWMRSAAEPDAEAPKASCFAGPPVPYAGLILVPVLEGAGMYLVAINVEGGATQWRTFLGDEPQSGTVASSAIMVSVDGGEAYVATGAGLVFSVDAISGAMNWAVRYPRTPLNNAERQNQMRRFGGFMPQGMGFTASFDGWAEEMIIPTSNAVIVTPVDFNHVVAFDRRSGSLLWESARTPGEAGHQGDYALGAHAGKFYIAGNDVVRCYKVAGGRMLWESTFEPGYGRGALTPDGIYVPAASSKVIKLGLEDGARLTEYSVAVEDDQPVGNLYCDGERVFGMGLQRVYAIGKAEPAKEEPKDVEKKDGAKNEEKHGIDDE